MSKRAEYEFEEDRQEGRFYWKSLSQLHGDSRLLAELPAELPAGAAEPPDGVSRRTFFNLMGASVAMAGLAACRRPEEKIVPYTQGSETQLPGNAQQYATVTTWNGTAVGILVESNDGRPTKIEGNPLHPESVGGGVVAWVQASILDMYDPDRASKPQERAGEKDKDGKATFADRTWAEAAKALKAIGQKARTTQGGSRLAIITEGHRSPTLRAALNTLKAALPGAKIIRWEPISRDAQREGHRLIYGKALDSALDLAKTKVLVTLDADILDREGSVVKQARGWAKGREPGPGMNRHYTVDSSFTVTAAAADHRLRLSSRQVAAFAHALAGAVGGDLAGLAGVADRAGLSPDVKRWAAIVAKDLAANRGASLVVAGGKQPPVVHALCAAINAALGNVGATIKYYTPFDEATDGAQQLVQLSQAIDNGAIDTVIVLGGNPVFNAPADAPLAEQLGRITTVRLGSHFDETSAVATWALNRSHDLESWSDAVAEDGTAAIVQPLIAPIFDSRTDAELITLLLGAPRRGYELVRETWAPLGEKAWRRALHDGVIAGSALAPLEVTANVSGLGRAAPLPPSEGFEITFAADHHAWDGRQANNPWLQEWPDPMNKLTWGNVAWVSEMTAAKLGVSDGQTIAIETPIGSARLPVLIAPGQAEDSIQVTVGQGRRLTGKVGEGIGSDMYVLRSAGSLHMVAGPDVKISALGGDARLARTQEHFSLTPMKGFAKRPLVREGTLARYQAEPAFARLDVLGEKNKTSALDARELFNLWSEQKTDVIHKWGMSIDLNKCTGCSACQVACQAENNIPVVGADGVRRSREMNWLRVDRYFEGTAEDPRAVAQPMPCQQCENAPCEQVCPVAATVHSPEGLNDMTYNRCVGTRYCANNCPFKVRKFNFFNYAKHIPELHQMQFNPDVTVRSRGVMEKCTYCVQRIQEAKIAGKKNATDKIKDGTIKTACQQACPSGAIVFGDYNDPEAELTKLSKDPRAYRLLDEINVRARTIYLARIRNVNPELEQG